MHAYMYTQIQLRYLSKIYRLAILTRETYVILEKLSIKTTFYMYLKINKILIYYIYILKKLKNYLLTSVNFSIKQVSKVNSLKYMI